jgi:hypothetical protein
MKVSSLKEFQHYYNGHFFDKETMRFFKSRIGEEFLTENFILFITSEQNTPNARKYSLRVATRHVDKIRQNKSIKTLGAFNVLSSYQAKKLAKRVQRLLTSKGKE